MSKEVEIKGTTSFTPSGAQEVGSGYYIGDGLILTAGHVYYYTNAEDDPANRAFDTLSGYTASSFDLRGYETALRNYYLQLPNPLPSNRDTPGEIKVDNSLRLKDTIFLQEAGISIQGMPA